MQRRLYYYKYPTRAGLVQILPEQHDRWQIVFDNEGLGSYHSPEAAADDASGGHTFSPSSGIDLGSLGIPEDLSLWQKALFATISRLRPV